MKKLLFIGHSYHQKTRSNVFVLDLFRQEYEISECYMDPVDNLDCQELMPYAGQTFDALVIWQVMPSMTSIGNMVTWHTALFFPMYDHFYAHGGLFQDIWEEYQNAIIVCFSKTLHRELKANGYDARYIQYYPQPRQVENWGDEHSVFFWQRLSVLNLSTLAAAMKNSGLKTVHLHHAPDPGHQTKDTSAFDAETIRFYQGVKRTESSWFDNHSQLLEEIDKHAFYMAPRHCEGIGMSFLEAMASGRVVIAPDMPTMNEYIENGRNGILYGWDEGCLPSRCRKSVKMPDCSIRDIQQNAYQSIVEGSERWCCEKSNILLWAGQHATPDHQLLSLSSIRNGRKNWPLAEQPFPNSKELEDQTIVKGVSFAENPVVSVVTVVFNAIKDGRRDMFLQCIESVQHQKGVAIEHVIVDGGSTDGTVDLIRTFQNQYVPIRYVSMKDQGIYDAMNRGLVMAKGDYVTYLNSDDFYHHPTGLADSVMQLQRTGCAFSFAPVTVLDDVRSHNPHTEPHLYISEIFHHAVFSHQSMLVNRQLMLEMHGFDLSYRSAADYEFVLRLILTGQKGCYVESNFVSYRMIGISSTNTRFSGHESGLIYWRLYNQYLGAHLSRDEACRLHFSGTFPAHSESLQKRMKEVLKTAFVGLPEELSLPSSHWKGWGFAIRCLLTGRWHVLRDFLLIQGNSRFRTEWYHAKYYQEVVSSGLPAAAHYLLVGWRKGYDPSPRFSTRAYLRRYPDVCQMDICPLIHWKLKGKREGRYCE